jgi:hypothetical protein
VQLPGTHTYTIDDNQELDLVRHDGATTSTANTHSCTAAANSPGLLSRPLANECENVFYPMEIQFGWPAGRRAKIYDEPQAGLLAGRPPSDFT